jgi:hypothetical protein
VNFDHSGPIGEFSIEVLHPNVNNNLGYLHKVVGPTIATGTFTGVTLCPNNPVCDAADMLPNQGNTHDVTLKATTQNTVPAGGLIFIEFPTGANSLTLLVDTC